MLAAALEGGTGVPLGFAMVGECTLAGRSAGIGCVVFGQVLLPSVRFLDCFSSIPDVLSSSDFFAVGFGIGGLRSCSVVLFSNSSVRCSCLIDFVAVYLCGPKSIIGVFCSSLAKRFHRGFKTSHGYMLG